MQFSRLGSCWIRDSMFVSSYSPLNTLHKTISVWISIATICSIQVLGNEEPVYKDMYSYVGGSVTLSCSGNVYFDYGILWYRENDELYLSSDNKIFGYVPSSMRDRMSVTCDRDVVTTTPDTCELTINPVIIDDSGRYSCRFSNSYSQHFSFGHISLNISTGILPPDDSPKCKMVKQEATGGYKQVHSSSVGDEIYLRCSANAADISVYPTFVWKRNRETEFVSGKGRSLQTGPMTLEETDVGTVFECVMSHPGISEPRTCTIIPLPSHPTTTLAPTSAIPTKSESETNGPLLTTTVMNKISTEFLSASQPKSSQSFLIPVVVAVISLILVIITLVVLLLIKRCKKQDIHKKPKTSSNQGLNSDATEYVVLRDTPNAISKTDDMNSGQAGAIDQLKKDHCNSTATADEQETLVSPVYAKPDKSKKTTDRTERNQVNDTEYALVDAFINRSDQANLVHQTELYANIKSPAETSGCLDDTEEQEGLMYAELDLTNGPKSDDVTVALNPDATVYADIQRS